MSPKIKINARLSGFFSETDFAEGGDLIGGTINSVIREMLIRTKKQELLTFTHDVSAFEYKSYIDTV